MIVEQIFFSPQVKQSVIISNKLVYTSASRVPEQLKTWGHRKLENIRKKVQHLIELLPSAQCSFRNSNFVSTSKNLLKNRN